MKKVLVAMSGGVDSSVAAALLIERGFDVQGVTLRMLDCVGVGSARGRPCCSPGDVDDAQAVADKLGINHRIVDARREFIMQVKGPAMKTYLSGRTPNPCVSCNLHIKFGLLLKKARSVDAEFVGTGHYARVEHVSTGTPHLLRATDEAKDQSYVLFQLISGDLLSRIVFPLGSLTKQQVRAKAQELGLEVASKNESQDLCFSPWVSDDPGLIVDSKGRLMGEHRGISRYTIGQRRGLGVATGEKIYVLGVRPETNEVVVGEDKDLYTDTAEVADMVWVSGELRGRREVLAQIRYGHKAVPAVIVPQSTGGLVTFSQAQRAVTPGQALVCYQDDQVVGGGWITGPNLIGGNGLK